MNDPQKAQYMSTRTETGVSRPVTYGKIPGYSNMHNRLTEYNSISSIHTYTIIRQLSDFRDSAICAIYMYSDHWANICKILELWCPYMSTVVSL